MLTLVSQNNHEESTIPFQTKDHLQTSLSQTVSQGRSMTWPLNNGFGPDTSGRQNALSHQGQKAQSDWAKSAYVHNQVTADSRSAV